MLLSVINPFLLRNTREAFGFTFVKQLESLPNNNVVYIINRHYINSDVWKKYRDCIEFGKLTKIENMNVIVLDDDMLDKIQDGYNQDSFYIKYLTEIIAPLQAIFSDIIDQVKKNGYPIEAVLSWGNCPSLESVARENNIPTIYSERAPLRSPFFTETSYFDFSGVNGNTESSARFEKFVDEFIQTPQKLLSKFELQGLVLNGLYKYYRDVFKYKYPVDTKVGLALQVENDSNMLAFSKGYDNHKLIEYAINRFKRKELLIRKHPFGKDDYSDFGENDNSKNSLDFMLNCDRIVTINSGSALEALLFGIKVDIVGDSPFFIVNKKKGDLLGDKYKDYLLNFFILNYIIPSSLSYDVDYIDFRLKKPSESKIFSYHLRWWQAKPRTMHESNITGLLVNPHLASRYRDVQIGYKPKCLSYELLFSKKGNESHSGLFYSFNLGESVEINIKKEQMLESDKVKIRFYADIEIILNIQGFFSGKDDVEYNLNHNGIKLKNTIIFPHKAPEIEIDFCSKVIDDLCLCVEIQLSSEIDNDLKFQINQAESKAQQAEVRATGAESKAQQAEVRATGAESKAQQAATWFFRKRLRPTRMDVITAYRCFLGREPENESVVIGHMQIKTVHKLINSFMNSKEFKMRMNLNTPSQSGANLFFSYIKRSLGSLFVLGLQGVRAVPLLKRMLSSAARRFPSVGTYFLTLAAAHPRPFSRALNTTRRKPVVNQQQYGPSRIQRTLVEVPTKTKRVLYYYVDHTISCPVNTGMQRVARGLARGLIEVGEDVIFVRWSTETKALVKINRDQLKHLCKWQGPIMSPQMTAAYPVSDAPDEHIGKHNGDDGSCLVVPEVTHINFHGYPTTLDVLMRAKEAKLKTAFIFYDAIPLRCDEFADMSPLHAEYMQILMLTDLVVPISRWSARDLISFFVHHEKSLLTAIPVVEPLLLPSETRLTEDRAKPPAATQKIILSVGTIERRKNHSVLLEAFESFCACYPDTGWKLVLVGNLHQNMAAEVNAAVLRNKKIIYRGNVSDKNLDELYRACTFTVFPSKDEGFGLPIVESLSYGKPCVCANFGAMAEAAAGGGCFTVDVRDAGMIESAIVTLISDLDGLRKLEREAVARKRVTWSDYTKDFCSLLDLVTTPKNKIGKIFYWVDQTCIFPANTGIQRVVRGLARALLENGLDLVPVKWDMATGFFVSPTSLELSHLTQWNGPLSGNWSEWDAKTFESIDWLLIPEVISAPSGPNLTATIAKAHAYGLRVATFFYDAIPWKMRDIYPPQATDAHGSFMRALNDSDIVFSISEYSNEDLLKFLRSQPLLHTPNLFERLRAVLLPGEFRETPRNIEIKPVSETVRILCVGTVEPRKNHITLLKAFAMVQMRVPSNKRVELTIVGIAPFPELEKKVKSLVQSIPGTSWEQEIDDSHLREFYHLSDFTIFPSLEEGFGLPILESLWNARPCICRNVGSMLEIGEGGGCLMVDTADVDVLASGIMQLVTDDVLRLKLAQEAVSRPFKKWRDYAEEIVKSLAENRVVPFKKSAVIPENESQFRKNMINLERRPILSICVTTYNRAEWLALSLKNLARLISTPISDVEIVVCDNASTDHTKEVIKPYEARSDFRYYRNPSNVGMLGNLRVTAHHARGRYIWILGDDDLVAPGAIEKVLTVISQNPDAALIYLNYAYTREEDATRITNLDKFFTNATPITKSTPDLVAPISRLSTLSENFFTAIYCLIFRRDHALRAYTQDTSGRPFSTMLTCIPTTYYVLNNMMNEKGVWLGTPQVVVNMNVSWLKYASLWILERIPEVFDLAEKMGARRKEIDECRIAHLSNIWHWFGEIMKDDPEGNAVYFNPARFFSRFKHLREFQVRMPELIKTYREAHFAHPARFPLPPEELFPTSSHKDSRHILYKN